jgi:predicted lysophospholipase L1 biosynthesis ABC-type transport system permease subunit
MSPQAIALLVGLIWAGVGIAMAIQAQENRTRWMAAVLVSLGIGASLGVFA